MKCTCGKPDSWGHYLYYNHLYCEIHGGWLRGGLSVEEFKKSTAESEKEDKCKLTKNG